MCWIEREPDRDVFDDWLVSEPVPIRRLDPEQQLLHEAFGLRGSA